MQPTLRMAIGVVVVVLCVLGVLGILPGDPRALFLLIGLVAVGLVL